MNFTAHRFLDDGESSVADWRGPDGARLCVCLEPGALRLPFPGIPVGTYPLRLRTVGEKHQAYLNWYGPDFHKGMIEICDVPDREAVEFHVGNTIADTKACSLCGDSYSKIPGAHYAVGRSRVTYEKVYPVLRDAILAGEVKITITKEQATAGV